MTDFTAASALDDNHPLRAVLTSARAAGDTLLPVGIPRTDLNRAFVLPTGADGECDRRARRRIAEPACRTHAEAFSLSKLFLLRWLRFLVAQDLCQS
jgi:hypothetical protein